MISATIYRRWIAGITVEVKDNGLINSKQAVKIAVGQAVWMLTCRSHTEQVDHVDKTDLEIRKMLSRQKLVAASIMMFSNDHHHIQ